MRGGLAPIRVPLPGTGDLAVRVHRALARKGAGVSEAEVRRAIARGDVVEAGGIAYVYRPVPDETRVDLPVLCRTDHAVVVDKPAGISSHPQGSYVARSVLVQARRIFGNDVALAHRLDRPTSGALLIVTTPAYRSWYQDQFASRSVGKVYEFASTGRMVEPATIRSRIDSRGRAADGPVNAETRIEPIGTAGPVFLYRARPLTGRTHQIRVHAAAAGLPILGDGDHPDEIVLLSRSLTWTEPDFSTVTATSTMDLVHIVTRLLGRSANAAPGADMSAGGRA